MAREGAVGSEVSGYGRALGVTVIWPQTPWPPIPRYTLHPELGARTGLSTDAVMNGCSCLASSLRLPPQALFPARTPVLPSAKPAPGQEHFVLESSQVGLRD